MVMPSSTMPTAVSDLPPAYFAMVMATGIVSIAAQLLGFSLIAVVLLWLNLAFYAVLWLLTLGRILWFPGRLLADLFDFRRRSRLFNHRSGNVYCRKPARFAEGGLPDGSIDPCVRLWACGSFWIYAGCTVFVIREDKPSLKEGINGTWLLCTVSTQSVPVLSGRLINHVQGYGEILAFLAMGTFFLGCVFYLIIITLIFYRFMFFQMSGEALGAPYWINMGAVAITTLAGSTLASSGHDAKILAPFMPFITGLTLMFWSVASGGSPF